MRAIKLEPAQRNSFQHTYRIGGNQVWGRGLSSKTTQTFLSPFNALIAFRHPAKSYHTSSLLLITSKKAFPNFVREGFLAEGKGFEPLWDCSQTVFKISCLPGFCRNLTDDKWRQNPYIDGDLGVFLFEPPQNLFPTSIRFLMRFLMN